MHHDVASPWFARRRADWLGSVRASSVAGARCGASADGPPVRREGSVAQPTGTMSHRTGSR